MCSNVKRNPFNQKFYQLSYDNDICDSEELEIILNEDSILTFCNTTLNDPNYVTRYVHSIGSLFSDSGLTTGPPCIMERETCWMPLTNTSCEPNSLHPESEAHLASLIATSSDTNSIARNACTLHDECDHLDRHQKGFEINVDRT